MASMRIATPNATTIPPTTQLTSEEVGLLWLVVLVIFLLAWINLNAEVASPSIALQAGKRLRYVSHS